MRAVIAVCISIATLPASAQGFPDSTYAPLWNYNGTWKINIPGKSPDTLINHCARTGLFFACEQNVNGNPEALVVFVPLDAEGHYQTSTVSKNGTPMGPGDLEIKGNHWTYMGKSEDAGKVTWFRTTNDFSDDSHIHFEQSQSTDKTHWQVQRTGDEVRTDKGTK